MPRDFVGGATYALAGGLNDFIQSSGTSAAAVYANQRTLIDLAKAAGARTVLATIPTPANSWNSLNSGANGTRLAALNALIRNGYAAGHFDFLVDANAVVPAYDVDATKWHDTLHPNGAGNALWAAEFLARVVA
jgi:lysophospholipase L1-like esterase